MKIEEEPLFHMDELNPKLYEHVHSIQEVKVSTLTFYNGYYLFFEFLI